MHAKIFCIGLSRTGTTTLHEILCKLGFNSKHYFEELITTNNLNILDQYDAVADTPIPLLYKELDERFPGSKFILTTRNVDDWLSSMRWLFRHGRIIWNWTPELGAYNLKLYGCNRFDRVILEEAFVKYHEDVRTYFQQRSDDFLEIDIDRGFNVAAICRFVQIPAKEMPVERSSDRRKATLWEYIKYYLSFCFLRPVKRLLGKV